MNDVVVCYVKVVNDFLFVLLLLLVFVMYKKKKDTNLKGSFQENKNDWIPS